MSSGLILEGGGMRGIFTAGVIDWFIENDIVFDNCIGVSAGACHACNYLSKQRGRSYKTIIDYIDDKRYCSVHSLVKTGDMFGVDFVYNRIPNELLPYSYETFDKSKTKLQVVMTDCVTGKAVYPEVKDMHNDIIYVRASSSLPLISRKVKINNRYYMDGGIADSIPITQSIKQGNDKNVVIMTREREYKKNPIKMVSLMNVRYAKYPEFIKSIKNRYSMYNETLDYIYNLEKEGKIFLIQPEQDLGIGRLEKNKERLGAAYQKGYDLAKKNHKKLMEYLES